MKKWFCLLVLGALLLQGCKNEVVRSTSYPLEFDAAVRAVANDLMGQLKANQTIFSRLGLGKTTIVYDQFVDADTGEASLASRDVEKILFEESRKAFPTVTFDRMSPGNLEGAHYVITGVIRYEDYQGSGKDAKAKYYKISSAIVDLKSGLIVASTDAWVVNRNLDLTPTAFYKDTPMYLKDKRVESMVITASTPPGMAADREYFNSLPTTALIAEAEAAYEKGDMDKAIFLFSKATERPDGQVMKTYSGLYQAYRKQNRASDAENAFGKLVQVGINQNNLSVKFLFAVGSVDFFSSGELRTQYPVWLRQLALMFSSSKRCLDINGHTSRTGSETFNEKLSLQRALRIQQLMEKDFPNIQQRSRAHGKGWKENIIGSGADDIRDAVDRRVEFKVRACD